MLFQNRFFKLAVFAVLCAIAIACGVKGPPLPPLGHQEYAPKPSATPSPEDSDE